MKYEDLKQTHKDYNRDLWAKLDHLYEGGFTMLDHASTYIPKMSNESEIRYTERLATASYHNYLGMICDNFSASLFTKEISVQPSIDQDEDGNADPNPPDLDPFWGEFAGDADLMGNPFSKVARDAFGSAILKRKAIIAVDFPRLEDKPKSAAEQDAQGGARGYAWNLPIEQLIDWEYSGFIEKQVALGDGKTARFRVGLFSWCIIHRVIDRRDTPEDRRGTIIDEFKVWRMAKPSKGSTEPALVSWEIYQSEPHKVEEPIEDETVLKKVGDGETSFPQIPLIEMSLPLGLWIGNKIGPLALEHFRQKSALNAAQNRTLFPLSVIKLGSEIGAVGGAVPAEVQQNPNRGEDPTNAYRNAGFIVLGAQDSLEYASPDTSGYGLVDQQLERSVDEMCRVGNQMAVSVSNTRMALGRSGESKSEDRAATNLVLRFYGAIMRDFVERVYGVLSVARREETRWTATGLDGFDEEDRGALVEEAVTLDAVSIPSPTFKKLYKTYIATRLINTSAENKEQIRLEISDGVDAELVIEKQSRAALAPSDEGDNSDNADNTPPQSPEEEAAPPPKTRPKPTPASAKTPASPQSRAPANGA